MLVVVILVLRGGALRRLVIPAVVDFGDCWKLMISTLLLNRIGVYTTTAAGNSARTQMASSA
jgi:hypothetical protein